LRVFTGFAGAERWINKWNMNGCVIDADVMGLISLN
jgi:hypothetical protein